MCRNLNENTIKVIKTKDGTNTIFDENFNESLHSSFGALTESQYIFIEQGFLSTNQSEINILEIGFGTGLNASLTLLENQKQEKFINYYGIEKFPPPPEILQQFYAKFPKNVQDTARLISSAKWNEKTCINSNFSIHKKQGDFLTDLPDLSFDAVYFDPFSPEKHPEAWTKEFLSQIYDRMKPNGILVTYSSKGIVKQSLRAVGFTVKRLPGPPGKRHILKAVRKLKVRKSSRWLSGHKPQNSLL